MASVVRVAAFREAMLKQRLNAATPVPILIY